MQIQKTQTGGVITYDSSDWRAGLAPQGLFSQSQDLAYSGFNGFSTMSSIDPFATYGVLSPGTASSSNATNSSSLSGAIVAFELTDNSTGIGVDAGGKVQKITTSSSTPSITVAGVFPHTITGTSPIGQDGILYRANYNSSSVVSFFYSFINNGNWGVGAYEVVAGTFDSGTDNFMSARPVTPLGTGDSQDATQITAPHPLAIGADGILYIGSGRYLHAYDGNTGATYGTFSSKVLSLPQGTQIVSMHKHKDIFLLACNYYSSDNLSGVGQALLFTWDYTSLDIIDVVDLEDFYVSSVFLWKGNPTVTTNGAVDRNGANKVKVISGNSVTTIASFSGVLPIQRGIVVLSNVIYMNAGGYINTVGDKFTPSQNINNIALLGTQGVSGCLFYNTIITNISLTGSASNGSGTYVFNNINNGAGSGGCSTTYLYPDFPFGKMGRIKAVEVEYFTPLASSASNGNYSLSINVDSGTSNNLIIANKSTVTVPLIRRFTRTTAGNILPIFSALQLQQSWNTSSNGSSPKIARISIEYDLIEITN